MRKSNLGKQVSDSDYQNWLKLAGNAGKTMEQYYNYLRQPAIDAAENIASVIENNNIIINNLTANLSPTSSSFSDQELVWGTYNVGGKLRTLYAKTFVLSVLPKTIGETKEFDISNEPLGFNLFIKVDSIIVSDFTEKANSSFFMNLYDVTKVYVNSDAHTIIEIKCKETVAVDYVVQLKLIYARFFGDVINLELTLPAGVDPSTVSLSFPKLKYNKDFLCSYTIDDCPVRAYDKIWTLINNKPVNTGLIGSYYHVGQTPPEDAYYPNKTLGYTDGCGTEHRFACWVAIWANNRNGLGNLMMGDGITPVGNYSQPYLKWTDLPPMLDFGWTICQHDINEDAWGTSDYTQLINGFEEDQQKAKSLINRASKIVMRPNGNDVYVTAVKNTNKMVMICSESNSDLTIYPKTTDVDLRGKNVKRRFLSADNSATEIAFIDSLYGTSPIEWYHISSHTPGTVMQEVLQHINDTYGKDGLDNVWFASVDEYYEYIYMIRSSVSLKTINGQTVTYKIYVPTDDNFYYRSITANLSGITTTEGLTVTSNCNGMSFGIYDNQLAVNLNFNPGLLSLVEKYVSKYESTLDSHDLEDAQYFVQKLKSGVKESYETRLGAVNTEIYLTSLTVNSGAPETSTKNVTINSTYSGNTPTHIMFSENSNFSGATWEEYASNKAFVLSDGNETKTIYAKIKDAVSESGALSTSITLNIETQSAVTAVISLSNPTVNSIEYETLADNSIINYTSVSTSTYYTRKRFKAKTGELLPWYFEQNTTDFYAPNSETNTSVTYLGGTAGQQPVFTDGFEDTGVYPDRYITKVFNATGNCSGGASKGRIVFTLPVGTYTMKLIDCISTAAGFTDAQRQASFYKVNVNGVSGTPVVVGPSGFTGITNRQFNAEINFTVDAAADGNVVLYLYNTANIYYKPGVNLIEITKNS